MRHGVTVSIAELDPAVYRYARDYFSFPQPTGQVFLEDARLVLARRTQQYDYIVHDVFTGGSVPGSLFTAETWRDVQANLKPHGVLAVVRFLQPGSRSPDTFDAEFCRPPEQPSR
jgi:spermidine synthase